MLSWFRSLFGGRKGAAPAGDGADAPSPGAYYDAARWTQENKKHWAWADDRGPRSSTDRNDRRELRRRARYEDENNSYCRGLTQTLAYTFVGRGGPTLQFQTPDQAANKQLEEAYAAWSDAIRWPHKLRIAKRAKTVDGETFGLFVTNPKLSTSVKLDLKLLETEQFMTPGVLWPSPTHIDGIDYDEHGNPVIYHMLKNHPGDFGWYSREIEKVPASRVLHWFRADRPGQPRGISELTTALPLFAMLRRFTLATLSAAETAANFAAIMKTIGPPNVEGVPTSAREFPLMEIIRGMLMGLPAGYDITQLKAEHPGTTYEMFVRVLIREIARSMQIPLTVALLDSSLSNFSSSRLDHQVYRQSVDVERGDCEREMLEPAAAAWYDEAFRIPKLLPRGLPGSLASIPHAWHWPAWEYLDPLVDRQAITEGLDNGSLTPQQVAARQGDDWRTMITQRLEAEAWDAAERKRLGLPAKDAADQGDEPAPRKGKKSKKKRGTRPQEAALAA